MTYTYRRLKGKDRMITSKMRINIVKYRVYLLLFVAGLGDLGTSLYNSSIGVQETRPFAYPFLATLIFCAFVWSSRQRFFSSVPTSMRRLITAGVIYLAFTPLLWNSLLVVGFGAS